MAMAGGSSPDTFTSSGTSILTSRPSQSDYDPSVSGDERLRSSLQSSDKHKPKSGKPRWFTQVKDWLSVSEPSAQAMKEQKRNTYKRHGIDMNDPRAAAKLHLPIGKIPENAITSTSGPSPEKALKRAQQQHQQSRQSYSGHSQASHSMSSSIYSVPSAKEFNPVTPWDT
ncbi:hypothetical protein CEP54_014594 [Fusarium duplospermum]|uniref:Uncharacterized protein n=1 Tax=Fusarium duplospermum TaxID=1325734 RepID=A0A428NV69_9HYPO|nr:hypothetical protein CEP54_014594 [Fusarium duplospermum]